jgi:E3 Ubiquitin ligase
MFWTIILLLVAVAFWLAGGALLYMRHRVRHDVNLMERTPTSSVSVVSTLSAGTPVEVKGTLHCRGPLLSEMAQESCACFISRVTREYETSTAPTSEGRRYRQRATETLAETAQAVPFSVEDATGEVYVYPEGSKVDGKKVVDRFEDSANPGFTLGGAAVPFDEHRNTLGYRYTESVLPVDAPVYVLGVVRQGGGIGASMTPVDAPVEELPLLRGGNVEVNLPSSRDRERRFVISHRSEEALERELSRTAFWLSVAALGAFILAVVLSVLTFVVASGTF